MWLIIEDEGGACLTAVPLPEGEHVLGRDPGCWLVLAGERVSRRHVALERRGGRVTFRDLGSSGGTFVDGREVASGELAPGARLQVGRRSFRLEADVTGDRWRSVPAAGPAPADWRPFGAFLERLRQAAGPREVVEHLLQGLLELLQAERGMVLLPERPGGRFVPVVTRAMADQATVASVSSTLCRMVVERGTALYVRDTSADEACQGTASLGPEHPARTLVCGPLRSRGVVLGVVYLDMPRSSAGGERAHLPLFETVAGLAAEVLSGAETRRALLDARGRLAALSVLGAEDEQLVAGEGPAAAEVARLIESAAPQDVTVLVTGETGTGKEMVARAVHRLSRRRTEPFVAVNCAALPRDLVAAELFGVERGAFTGATERRPGRFEVAGGGTLFLDEVGELPLDVQATLLRVLQERAVTRVGGSEAVPLDFRLVCATNVDLERAVGDGSFRADLYYRINVFRVPLRPLRERPEDLLPLARHFLERLGRQQKVHPRGFAPEAEALIRAYPWPGNVRELRNAVEHALIVERGDLVQAGSLPVSSATALPPAGHDQAIAALLEVLPGDYGQARTLFEGAFLKRLLQESRGNIAAAARRAGMSRCAIYRRLQALGLLPGGEGAEG